jgi:di/tricarboxylate transporter
MNIIFALNYNWELIFWLSIPCLFVLISLLLIIVHIKFKLDELKHGNDKTKVKQSLLVKLVQIKIKSFHN